MRRVIVLTVAAIGIALAFPALHVNAVCAPAPQTSSAAGLRTMRSTPFIVWGTIEGATPADAHGAHSIFLKVRGYFKGTGPARIEVSDYGDGSLPPEASAPGASIDASKTFAERFAGQDAVVFATPDTRPYTREFSTTACTYTAYGDAASSDILPLLRRVFGAPQPPVLAGTGPAAALPLLAGALALIVAGATLRRGGRETLVRAPRAR